MDQRDVHFRRHQRDGQFDEGPLDATRAAGVRCRAGTHHVAAGGLAGIVGEGDGAVEAIVTVIGKGLATKLQSCRDTRRSCRHEEEVGPRELEIPHGHGGFAHPRDIHHEAVDDRLGVTDLRTSRGIDQTAANEGVVGIRRRARHRILEQGAADRAHRVIGLRGRIHQGRFPVEAVPLATKAGQEPRRQALHIDLLRARVEHAVVLHDQGGTFGREGGRSRGTGQQAGQAVGTADRAERVPVGVRGHDDRSVRE